MALSDANSKAIVKQEFINILGAPASDAQLELICTVIGKAINRILKEDAVVTSAGTSVVSSGSSSGSWPVTSTGTIS